MSLSRRVAAYAASSVALSLLIACAQAPAPSDDAAVSKVKTQRVFGGQPSTEDTDAVVYLVSGPGHDRYCSGTVVAPRLVITARHCIAPYVEGSYQCDVDGGFNPGLPRNPPDAGAVGLAYAPELVEVKMGQFPFNAEPAYGEKIYTVATDTICRNDIAIVRLDRELPVPPRPMRLETPTYPGELITVVGYGLTYTNVAGRHERHDVEILAVGESSLYPQGRGAYDRTFRLGQAACPGDSGGPSLSNAGAVLGVFSIVENECNSDAARNFYTQLAPYRSFIEDAFEDSGFEVIEEPALTSSTTGTGGSAGASGAAGAATDSEGSSGGSSSSAVGSTGSAGSSAGGSTAAGGSAGATTDGVQIIPGRRKKDDGCSLGVVGDAGAGGRWAPLLLGLLALRRRSLTKRAPR